MAKCDRGQCLRSYVYKNVGNTSGSRGRICLRGTYTKPVLMETVLSTADRILDHGYILAGTASGAVHVLFVSVVRQCPFRLTCHSGCRLHRWSLASAVFRSLEASRLDGETTVLCLARA